MCVTLASTAAFRNARSKLTTLEYTVTPIIYRQYFHSIFFREPGGVLFEIANPPFTETNTCGTTVVVEEPAPSSSSSEHLRICRIPAFRLTLREFVFGRLEKNCKCRRLALGLVPSKLKSQGGVHAATLG